MQDSRGARWQQSCVFSDPKEKKKIPWMNVKTICAGTPSPSIEASRYRIGSRDGRRLFRRKSKDTHGCISRHQVLMIQNNGSHSWIGFCPIEIAVRCPPPRFARPCQDGYLPCLILSGTTSDTRGVGENKASADQLVPGLSFRHFLCPQRKHPSSDCQTFSNITTAEPCAIFFTFFYPDS
jgi:hypothetical protein